MKNIVPICIILSLICVAIIALGSMSIYGTRNLISVNEVTHQGNLKAMDGVELALDYMESNDLNWNMNVKFRNGVEWENDFKTFYYHHYEEDRDPFVAIDHDYFNFESKEMIDQLIPEEVGKVTIKVADYSKYMPFRLYVSFDGSAISYFEGDNNIMRVKVPESATAIIEKDRNSLSMEIKDLPYISSDVPSVIIDNRMYFTLTNLELFSDYFDMGIDDLDYSITSGILSISANEVKNSKINFDSIQFHYPMEIDVDTNIAVLDLVEVREEGLLALITLEEQSLYIYIYDTIHNELITKKQAGEVPDEMMLTDIKVFTHNKYLLLNYQYLKMDDISNSNEKYSVAAAYEIEDNKEIHKLIENEYYDEINKSRQDGWGIEAHDMLYKDKKLYIVAHDYSDTVYFKSYINILLLALSNEEVLYNGTISNSMIEDYTIASSDNQYSMLTSYNTRRLNDFKFVKE